MADCSLPSWLGSSTWGSSGLKHQRMKWFSNMDSWPALAVMSMSFPAVKLLNLMVFWDDELTSCRGCSFFKLVRNLKHAVNFTASIQQFQEKGWSIQIWLVCWKRVWDVFQQDGLHTRHCFRSWDIFKHSTNMSSRAIILNSSASHKPSNFSSST